jgi:hypothetical protein
MVWSSRSREPNAGNAGEMIGDYFATLGERGAQAKARNDEWAQIPQSHPLQRSGSSKVNLSIILTPFIQEFLSRH